MRTPKQLIKDWLGISTLEDIVSTITVEQDIETLLDLAEAEEEAAPITKGYDAEVRRAPRG